MPWRDRRSREAPAACARARRQRSTQALCARSSARASSSVTQRKRLVARPQLTDLPQLGARRSSPGTRSRRGSVRPARDDRHVAGEIDRADRIGVVVNVRRMQARFTAVAARPLRLRADQAHAGAARVVVHLPARAKNMSMSSAVKKSGAPCGPYMHGDRPRVRIARNEPWACVA